MADRPMVPGLRRRLHSLHLVTTIVALVAAACAGSGATSASSVGAAATLSPTATATPDRHILETLDTNRVFQILLAAGHEVRQESLGGPGPKGEPAVILYLVDGPVHVAIRQYSTPAAVVAAGFKLKSTIARGDAPYEIWASNIVVDIGPSTKGVKPAAPDADVAAAAAALVDVLDPFLGPFQQRAVAPLTLPITPAPPSPSPSPVKPS